LFWHTIVKILQFKIILLTDQNGNSNRPLDLLWETQTSINNKIKHFVTKMGLNFKITNHCPGKTVKDIREISIVKVLKFLILLFFITFQQIFLGIKKNLPKT
jgi:hypothetical protein